MCHYDEGGIIMLIAAFVILMLSGIIQSVNIPIVITPSAAFWFLRKYWYAECHIFISYTDCHMLNVIMPMEQSA